MKRCKHEFTRLRFRDGSERQGMAFIDSQDVLSMKCDDCGVQLSLGPSDEEPVAVEIRAAEIDAVRFMTESEREGFLAHRDATDPPLDDTGLAGWLARELATHDSVASDHETRVADAWPWDVYLKIVDQQDSIAEAIQRMANMRAGIGDAFGNVYTDDHAVQAPTALDKMIASLEAGKEEFVEPSAESMQSLVDLLCEEDLDLDADGDPIPPSADPELQDATAQRSSIDPVTIALDEPADLLGETLIVGGDATNDNDPAPMCFDFDYTDGAP